MYPFAIISGTYFQCLCEIIANVYYCEQLYAFYVIILLSCEGGNLFWGLMCNLCKTDSVVLFLMLDSLTFISFEPFDIL